MNNGFNVPVESLIDHIKTAVDVDPWAKEMAEKLLKGRCEATKIARFENRSCSWFYVCSRCGSAVDLQDMFCRDCGCCFTGYKQQQTETNKNKI